MRTRELDRVTSRPKRRTERRRYVMVRCGMNMHTPLVCLWLLLVTACFGGQVPKRPTGPTHEPALVADNPPPAASPAPPHATPAAPAPAPTPDPTRPLVEHYVDNCRYAAQVEAFDEWFDACAWREIDQMCEPDPSGCWGEHQACLDSCQAPCTSCEVTCGDTCSDCRAACGEDAACIETCASARESCHETCMSTRLTCLNKTCDNDRMACERAFQAKVDTQCTRCDAIRRCIAEERTQDPHGQTTCQERFSDDDVECFEWCQPE